MKEQKLICTVAELQGEVLASIEKVKGFSLSRRHFAWRELLAELAPAILRGHLAEPFYRLIRALPEDGYMMGLGALLALARVLQVLFIRFNLAEFLFEDSGSQNK